MARSCLPSWLVGTIGWPISQFYLSVSLFLAEMVASRLTGSLLLQSCAFYTLRGTLALAVRLMDARLAAGGHDASRTNTFGWRRAWIVGSLTSAVFLASLCLIMLAEALRRVADPRLTKYTLALMGIGAVDIPLHLARAGLPRRSLLDLGGRPCCCKRRAARGEKQEMEDLLGKALPSNGQRWMEAFGESDTASRKGRWQVLFLDWMMPWFGPATVFLYSLTVYLLWDLCLAPAARPCSERPCWAYVTAEPLWQQPVPCWLLYLDPGLAVAMTVALLGLTWPDLRTSALVLLQAAPESLDLRLLEQRLRATEGVAAVRELRVWQLDGHGSLVATAHLSCTQGAAYEEVLPRAKWLFCQHGIHASTVEPEPGPRGGQGPPERQPRSDPAEVLEYETAL